MSYRVKLAQRKVWHAGAGAPLPSSVCPAGSRCSPTAPQTRDPSGVFGDDGMLARWAQKRVG